MICGRKLPVGIQNFEDLRSNGYLYVDKTVFVFKLTTNGTAEDALKQNGDKGLITKHHD